jgi:hypothetical protein
MRRLETRLEIKKSEEEMAASAHNSFRQERLQKRILEVEDEDGEEAVTVEAKRVEARVVEETVEQVARERLEEALKEEEEEAKKEDKEGKSLLEQFQVE